jgi:hypothetical protein
MRRKHLKVWYGAEDNQPSVMFERRDGYFREIAAGQARQTIDAEQGMFGFLVSQGE